MDNPNYQKTFWKSDIAITSYLSLLYIILHIIFINQYGYFRDEFYYVACGEHLDFGYVDHPPLIAIIALVSRSLFGDSLLAIRILSVVAGGITVFLTALIVREIGGKLFSQIVASLAVIVAPVFLVIYHILSMNSFDILLWTIAAYILIKIIKSDNSKLWLYFGIVIGIGLQNKHSIIFLCFGLALGLLLTPNRKYLKDKWFWMGTLIAVLIFLPNLIWHIAHDFPTIEFGKNAALNKNMPLSPIEFFLQQILQALPIPFLLIILGLIFVFFTKAGKPYRLFGWVYLTIFILFVSTRAKVYYLSPIYPTMFAIGSFALGHFINSKKINWLKPIVIVLLISGFMLTPLALPVLPPETFIKYSKTLGLSPSVGERHEMGALPQHYADMFGWEDLARTVSEVYETLSPDEKKKTVVFGRNYGEAGAIDFFREKYSLPKAISGHNNYWLWGYGGDSIDIMIFIGGADKQSKLEYFNYVEEAAVHTNEYVMPYENNLIIYLCKGFKTLLKDEWGEMRHYE
ncbi:MAG: glycosyltransferase family 39 protein [Ignavibacteria bacterium]|nr:glycosyltransferase family 39 protein [Ignavibacteria bacterium]